jgi:hypothetical protein
MSSALCMEPCPPPALGAPAQERLDSAEARMMGLFKTIPNIFFTHPYLIGEGAGALAECGSNILNMVFTAQQLWCFYRGESYRKYSLEGDHSAALGFHREFLQYLQWGTSGKRWALKGSDHMLWLEELVAQYPDAMLLWTHRDMEQQLGSRVTGTVNTGREFYAVRGTGMRVRRQGIRRMGTATGHCQHSALFPSGRAVGAIAFAPRGDGTQAFNEGGVIDGEGVKHAATILEAPWMTKLIASGEAVPRNGR